jgi:hypothetical protein
VPYQISDTEDLATVVNHDFEKGGAASLSNVSAALRGSLLKCWLLIMNTQAPSPHHIVHTPSLSGCFIGL